MGLPADLPLFDVRRPETVTQLTTRIKSALADEFPTVLVQGEISNYRPPTDSGHLYFSLKDAGAVLNCAMWRGSASRLKFRPENGMQVLASGKIDVYLPRGNYQLIVDSLEPLGAGALQVRFEQLKEKLRSEGLFDPARKRPLPLLPASVAIVTSPSGAALQDMLRTIRSRCPSLEVYVYPVRVQGEGAADEIAAAIRDLNARRPEIDVMIVGRGGGSIEDLWAFNEEVVARALAASRILTISAVGHETDTTIADFAADVRALTPTDAATRVAPRAVELAARLDEMKGQLRRALAARAELARSTLDRWLHSAALAQPAALVAQHRQRLDDLDDRLGTALLSLVKSHRERLKGIRVPTPRELITRRRGELDALQRRLSTEIQHRLRLARERGASVAGHLDAVSPLAVLGRGYSITQDESGTVVRDASSVRPGDRIVTRLAKGRLRSRVEGHEA